MSTTEQHLDLQRDAPTRAGCGRLFTDTASGATAERSGLAEALHYLRMRDVLIVWKLDRLGRSLKDLLEIVTVLEHWGIGFKNLRESMDTTPPGGITRRTSPAVSLLVTMERSRGACGMSGMIRI